MRVLSVVRIPILCSLALVATSAAQAAQDIFLAIPGLDGGSADQQFRGAFDALSVSSGVSSQPGGKPTFAPVIVKLRGSSAGSPALEQAAATGQRISQAVVSLRRTGDNPFVFLTYTLTDVAVTSFQREAITTDEGPSESVSLTFARIQIEFRQQNADGSVGPVVSFCGDAVRNAPCQ